MPRYARGSFRAAAQPPGGAAGTLPKPLGVGFRVTPLQEGNGPCRRASQGTAVVRAGLFRAFCGPGRHAEVRHGV